jgi:hypothetical protein
MGSKRKLQNFSWQSYVNKYTLTLCAFLVWIVFLDKHNLITQHKLKSIIEEMETEKSSFEDMYLQAVEDKKLLEADQEKYAREKYFMHKDNEEVFIIKKD